MAKTHIISLLLLGTPLHEVHWVWVDGVLHGKSSDLKLSNEEAAVILATMTPLLLSVVLPICVSQYLRQHEAFEDVDDSSRLLAGSCQYHHVVARTHLWYQWRSYIGANWSSCSGQTSRDHLHKSCKSGEKLFEVGGGYPAGRRPHSLECRSIVGIKCLPTRSQVACCCCCCSQSEPMRSSGQQRRPGRAETQSDRCDNRLAQQSAATAATMPRLSDIACTHDCATRHLTWYHLLHCDDCLFLWLIVVLLLRSFSPKQHPSAFPTALQNFYR